MKFANKIFSIVLVVLLVATVYGLIRTGREDQRACREWDSRDNRGLSRLRWWIRRPC